MEARISAEEEAEIERERLGRIEETNMVADTLGKGLLIFVLLSTTALYVKGVISGEVFPKKDKVVEQRPVELSPFEQEVAPEKDTSEIKIQQ